MGWVCVCWAGGFSEWVGVGEECWVGEWVGDKNGGPVARARARAHKPTLPPHRAAPHTTPRSNNTAPPSPPHTHDPPPPRRAPPHPHTPYLVDVARVAAHDDGPARVARRHARDVKALLPLFVDPLEREAVAHLFCWGVFWGGVGWGGGTRCERVRGEGGSVWGRNARRACVVRNTAESANAALPNTQAHTQHTITHTTHARAQHTQHAPCSSAACTACPCSSRRASCRSSSPPSP